eukprot:181839-Pyramimonas_sp.AAC.1
MSIQLELATAGLGARQVEGVQMVPRAHGLNHARDRVVHVDAEVRRGEPPAAPPHIMMERRITFLHL